MAVADFVKRYQALNVGASPISINKYKMYTDSPSSPQSLARAALDSLKTSAEKQSLSPNSNAFARAKFGKVSPDDCEHILSLALQTNIVAEADLQSWADSNLGVDCTGLAVAYYASLKRIELDKYVGGAGCPFLIVRAIQRAEPAHSSPLIWALADVMPDDMILWMDSTQNETRKPGHISIVSSIDLNTSIMTCGESNGEPNPDGHLGPKMKDRTWTGENKTAASKNNKDGTATNYTSHYVSLSNNDRVVIVRPPLSFG